MKNKFLRALGLITAFLPALFFGGSSVYADDNINVSIATSCSMSATVGSEHNATVEIGTYAENIGETTFNVFCNDQDGFAIYAVGYGNDTYGNTTMVPAVLDASNSIATGTATSGNVSNWAMKLTAVSGTYSPTLTTGFNAYHVVPSVYTKVASYAANTDNVSGSQFKSTYATYVARNQIADTYTGKVKYIIVHPASKTEPEASAPSEHIYYAMTGEENNYTLTISDTEPASGAVLSGEIPMEGYAKAADVPWSETRDQITSVVVDGTVAPRTTNYWFYYLRNCASFDLDGLYMNNATSMIRMFYYAGYNITTALSIDVSKWDTSNVEDMSYAFAYFGRNSSSVAIEGLKNLDTSNVTNMQGLFAGFGYNITGDFVLDLTGWDTAKVEKMNSMFSSAGYSASSWQVKGLEGFDTKKVNTMAFMFMSVGRSVTTDFSLNLTNFDTSSVESMSGMFSNVGYNAKGRVSVNISSFDTGKVGTMASMFNNFGYNAAQVIITGIEDLDVHSVTTMSNMFANVAYYADNFHLDLSNWTTTSLENVSQIMYMTARRVPGKVYIDLSGWNTSHVTNTTNAFAYTGTYWASEFYLSIAGWDMSAVETITNMFQYCGDGSPIFAIIIPPTNGNGVANSTTEIHGKTADIVAANPLNGFYFTLDPNGS